MHTCQWHELASFIDFHYLLSKNRLTSNYFERALLNLISKRRYINGICKCHMDKYDGMYERWYKNMFERSSIVK